jgi:hypothetical protein
MTPKEKAKELVDKLDSAMEFYTPERFVKQCALIAVDEILKVVSFYNDSQAEVIYFEEVKQEIDLL